MVWPSSTMIFFVQWVSIPWQTEDDGSVTKGADESARRLLARSDELPSCDTYQFNNAAMLFVPYYTVLEHVELCLTAKWNSS